MRIEDPAALRFIIDEDLYLLDKDKTSTTISAPGISAPGPIETPLPGFKYLGLNKKNFLIVVHYTTHEFIDDAHLTALQNILKRKELYLDDVAILNLANYAGFTFEHVTAYFTPERLLLMGEKALPKNTNTLLLNQPQTLGSSQALYSFSFDEMMSSNDNKKVFWDQMKTL